MLVTWAPPAIARDSPSQETINILNSQGFSATPATSTQSATVNMIPLHIEAPGERDELGEYESGEGDNLNPTITLFNVRLADNNGRPLSDSEWADLYSVVVHELFHFLQYEYWKDDGEAEKEACPGTPPDPDCVEDFRDRIACHSEGDKPCVEVQAYNHSFWMLCAKAAAEEDPKKKNQLLRAANPACLKGKSFYEGCLQRLISCGPLPNPEMPPSDGLPSDCECPGQ